MAQFSDGINNPTTAYWSRGYAYDGLDRIASFVSEPRDQTFNYDATGNLLSKMDRVGTNEPFTHTYNISPTSNRMTGISNLGIGYTIDAAGNRTADSTTTWVVNARGRVSQVRVISGATTYSYNYLVNGQNLRVRKTGPSSVVPQGTQVFVYDEAGRLIGEYDNYGRARNEHVWLADRPVALLVYTYSGTSTTPLTTTYYSVEADHLGTPRMITDSAQAQRWTWHSAPYGDTQPNEKPGTAAALVYNLRFPGQYFDKEVNTFYNWHRDYESTTGRYIQSDPIGLAGGINTYTYVEGGPLTFTDPTGEIIPIVIVGGAIARGLGSAAFEVGMQWIVQGRDLECLDVSDIVIAGTIGIFLPGPLSEGKRGLTALLNAKTYYAKMMQKSKLKNALPLFDKMNAELDIAADAAANIAYNATTKAVGKAGTSPRGACECVR
jgi:RHS repeat-associated protein